MSVFDHEQPSDNLPTPPRPPLSLGWCSSEQLGSYIAAKGAKVAKSGVVTKKLDLKIDQLNHVVADKVCVMFSIILCLKASVCCG